MTNLVFVYGSLKKGFHNHHILGRSEFIAETITSEYYSMTPCGSFPILVENDHQYHTSGELYRVSDEVMASLDVLEGNGSFYQRKLIKVNHSDECVWCYFIIDEVYDLCYGEMLRVEVDGTVQTWLMV